MKKKKTLKFFLILILLTAFLIGFRFTSCYYYEKCKIRLFKMFEEARLGVTEKEAREFYERNKVFGMHMSKGSFENTSNDIMISVNFVLMFLGSSSSDSGQCWTLFLEFDDNRLTLVTMSDISGGGGEKTKRIGGDGNIIFENNPRPWEIGGSTVSTGSAVGVQVRREKAR